MRDIFHAWGSWTMNTPHKLADEGHGKKRWIMFYVFDEWAM
jgi:hypothetical protein